MDRDERALYCAGFDAGRADARINALRMKAELDELSVGGAAANG